MNENKIILDLCGGTGSWAKPYKENGYKVITITLPDYDVNEIVLWDGFITFKSITDKEPIVINRDNIYGILAAPPCTMFSFARTNAKRPRNLQEGMKCVRSCLNIIWYCMEIQQDTIKKTVPLKFWSLENPYFGLLPKFLGKSAFTFDPWEFGDGYQKRTALWGNFVEPKKNPVPMSNEAKKKAKTNSYLHTIKFDKLSTKDIHPEAYGKLDRQARRAITPQGFAQAFFKANQ